MISIRFIRDNVELIKQSLSNRSNNINLDEIVVKEFDGHSKQIKLDDTYMMDMKYPSLDQFIKSNFDFSENSNIDQSFDLIASCIDTIYSEEEAFPAAESTKKELREFLEQLNSGQFKAIESFFETMPKLSHTVKVLNPKTKVENEMVLEGLSSVFG